MHPTPSEVNKKLRRLLPHMLHVTENRETLKSLESVWDVLNLLGQLSGTTTEMGDTKSAFATLTGNLLHSLALTTFNKRVQEMAAPAQVAIDILVRNLFERTADIGFLATDDTLRGHAAAWLRGEAPDRAALVERLQAYVRRYSVYRDVILVAPDGTVLARLPDAPQVERIADPLLAQVLASDAPYTEAAVCSELYPNETRNLFYAVRVQDEAGNVLGALFLCFDFENEIGRVFNGLRRADDWSVIALMDEAGKVIASSDPYQVMGGAVVDAPFGDGHLLRFAGASYLASRHAAKGFQGYMGPPGWSALVLVPLDMAFDQEDQDEAAQDDDALVRAVLRSGTAFPPELQAIPAQADAIQRELNRSVWNANIRQGVAREASMNPAFSKVLLAEIVRTGTRMKEVFTRSIKELQTMVVTSQLEDCQFLAALAMDILDRNLYERSADSRWWALDPLLRTLLEDRSAEERSARLSARLAAVNDLYTVYDSLLVFDADGVVVAASRPHVEEWIGRKLDAPWCARALALPDAEHYTVSEFEPTELYGGKPAYVYAAALHGESGRAVGGIALVFDCGPQISAMLGAALPAAPGAFALFIDADNNVIASTDPQRAAGGRVNVPADVRAQAMEGGVARLVVLDGKVMAVGAHASAGYREYQGTEGRAGQRVLALVCVPLGEADAEQAAEDWMPAATPSTPPLAAGQVDTVDIASFYVGRYLLGVPASAVVEAIPFGGFVRLPNTSQKVRGAMVYRGSTMLIYDLHNALGMTPRTRPEDMLTVVLSHENGRRFGILVDRLADIPAVPRGDISPVNNVFVGMSPVLASVVKSSGDNGSMLTLLAVEHMAEVLSAPDQECDADPAALLK